jgi:hypothetical protein
VKTYYLLLGVDQGADPEEVKRAFRREIARYHPDKVQHLGQEFQEIAATRAAELTEAYRILMDPATRAAYDASIAAGGPGMPPPEPAARPQAEAGPPVAEPEPRPARTPEPEHVSETLRDTQATLSAFVRKATLGRLRDAIEAAAGAPEPTTARGFDASFVLKPRRGLFQQGDPAVLLLTRVVSRVDPEAIGEVWPLSLQASVKDATPCVLLLGLGMAPSRELAGAIADHRRRMRQTVPPILVPVDTRTWDALLPPETPVIVRKILERLKLGV